MNTDDEYLIQGIASDSSIDCVYTPNVGITGIENDFLKYVHEIIPHCDVKQEPLLPQLFPFLKDLNHDQNEQLIEHMKKTVTEKFVNKKVSKKQMENIVDTIFNELKNMNNIYQV